jgi:hypothetical protein
MRHAPLFHTLVLIALVATGCEGASAVAGTCTGAYPSFFQDPAFASTGMWDDQVVINRPPPGWQGPVFQLSDAYAKAPAEKEGPWLAFNPFQSGLSSDQKQAQAQGYIDAVIRYIWEGNIESGDVAKDWRLCENRVRPWYHIPYQTYDPMSGREFVHGLTREAPVTMTLENQYALRTTMWAVGFYNPAAGQSLGTVWTGAPDPQIPTTNFAFADGSVIGKLLFTTATPDQYPFLRNMPAWQANISAPEFCNCSPSNGGSTCTYQEQTEQCPRTVGTVYLLQFDIAVRDSRSPIGWAYGTFVADGVRKAGESNPWKRISALGLMWGNDTPAVGQGAAASPVDPRKNGFQEGVIFWDVVDMLNQQTNAGHLGCDSRLNGPADNAKSSCLSCHQTASVPDQNNSTPAILFQFSGLDPQAGQCMPNPTAKDLEIDQVYFDTFACSSSFAGPPEVVPPPSYASGAKQWISTDFSLQLSISLTQWQEWQQDKSSRTAEKAAQRFEGRLPAR